MKLSSALILSLFAYSSSQTLGTNKIWEEIYNPAPYATPKEIAQQEREEDFYRKNKIIELRQETKKMKLEAKKCLAHMHARFEQLLEEKYDPRLKNSREAALTDLYYTFMYCYKGLQKKEIKEENLYEKEHEK